MTGKFEKRMRKIIDKSYQYGDASQMYVEEAFKLIEDAKQEFPRSHMDVLKYLDSKRFQLGKRLNLEEAFELAQMLIRKKDEWFVKWFGGAEEKADLKTLEEKARKKWRREWEQAEENLDALEEENK